MIESKGEEAEAKRKVLRDWEKKTKKLICGYDKRVRPSLESELNDRIKTYHDYKVIKAALEQLLERVKVRSEVRVLSDLPFARSVQVKLTTQLSHHQAGSEAVTELFNSRAFYPEEHFVNLDKSPRRERSRSRSPQTRSRRSRSPYKAVSRRDQTTEQER